MSRLRTYAPMKRRSDKIKALEPEHRSVYERVDARSEGRCEVNLYPAEPRLRCPKRAADKHHTVKPRRSNDDENLIIAVCRDHHDRCEWPYRRGRLVTTALGGGRFHCALKYAADKFAARAGA